MVQIGPTVRESFRFTCEHCLMTFANIPELAPTSQQDRRHNRTHLLLGAVLYSKLGSCPVHVRNISETGAMIEGLIVPEQSETLILKRGTLEASATIVWKAGRKAGVAFSSTIFVSDWISKRPSVQQERVDDVIHSFRSGILSREGVACEQRVAPTFSMLEAELEALKGYLDELENGLTSDVVIIATHPEIQLLDVAQQAVDRIMRSLGRN